MHLGIKPTYKGLKLRLGLFPTESTEVLSLPIRD